MIGVQRTWQIQIQVTSYQHGAWGAVSDADEGVTRANSIVAVYWARCLTQAKVS